MEKNRVTVPASTKSRISRCTDQQVLPVNILNKKKFINLTILK